ncbi:hypothetical protein [uncultured Dialister sp.]|uniref:hypothetical protein n=1 Tax=uncultured Dialister sp. TaxID=278064 RepID=UPI002632A798|nr:hypothetical protein [uncultured Dialister sp.]
MQEIFLIILQEERPVKMARKRPGKEGLLFPGPFLRGGLYERINKFGREIIVRKAIETKD